MSFPNIRNKRSNSIVEIGNNITNTYNILLTGNLRKDYNNYGSLLEYFCKKSDWWRDIGIVDISNTLSDLSNKNSLSLIKHYIDGTDYFTIKDLFLSHIHQRPILQYKDFLLRKIYPSFPVYLKPSHAYIGGGNGIYFFNNKHELDNFSVNTILSPSLNYFFDPAISNPVKYNGKIWDCRTYMVMYKKECNLYVYGGNRGFCRLESIPHFTNLSLVNNNNINDYMIELNKKVVTTITTKFIKYFEKYFIKYIENNNTPGFVILGLDSMLSNNNNNNNIHPSSITQDYTINFIEINKSPVMLKNKNTIEGEITYDIFEEIIDKVLVESNFNNTLKSLYLVKKYDLSKNEKNMNKDHLKKYYIPVNEEFMKKRDKTLENIKD